MAIRRRDPWLLATLSVPGIHYANLGKEHRLPDLSYLVQAPAPPRTQVPANIREAIDQNLSCSQYGWDLREGGRTRLIDSFLFRNELDVLEVRLNELYDWIDFFLIVEMGTGHQGQFRNSTFINCLAQPLCAARFSPLLDKIQYVFVGFLEVCVAGDIWGCEKSHRQLLNWAFEELGGRDDDMIIVGDGDEFPHARIAWLLGHCAVPDGLTLEASLFFFSFHCRVPTTTHVWNKLKAVSGRMLKSIGAERVRRTCDNRWGDLGFFNLTDAGYHLSWFMSPEEMEFKIKLPGCLGEHTSPSAYLCSLIYQLQTVLRRRHQVRISSTKPH